jgi:hypothetical protein
VWAKLAGENGDSAGAAASGRLWTRGCPYRGLEPYREDDADLFYGREQVTRELASKLEQQIARGGLIAVTGPSGVGKSSLLRAGLVPMLGLGRQIPGSELWPRIVMTPTYEPLTELATHLAAHGGLAVSGLREELLGNPDQAHLAIRKVLLARSALRGTGEGHADAGAARLVLVIDQFEQILTPSGDRNVAQCLGFVTALLGAATRRSGPDEAPSAVVVLAVRGDRWDQCAASFPELAAPLEDSRFAVGPMTRSELRRAINGPADMAGLRIEPGLTDAILSDLHTDGESLAGVLPLLSRRCC